MEASQAQSPVDEFVEQVKAAAQDLVDAVAADATGEHAAAVRQSVQDIVDHVEQAAQQLKATLAAAPAE